MGNQVLLRFSPKSFESIHYFSDTAFVDELGIPFLETSATDSISVEQFFLTMAGETKKNEGIGLGVDGIATAAKTASLWASFRQEVVVWHKLDHQNVTKVHLAFDSSFG
ncbi:hypothetical protein REPUB_Repub14bG0049800 [Reevesia pubescens]